MKKALISLFFGGCICFSIFSITKHQSAICILKNSEKQMICGTDPDGPPPPPPPPSASTLGDDPKDLPPPPPPPPLG